MGDSDGKGPVVGRPRQLNVPLIVSIALGLVLGGILLSLLAQSRLVRAVNLTVQDTASEAVTIAKDRLEYVKALPADRVRTAAGSEEYGDIPGYPQYRRTTALRFGNGQTTATVTVYWNEGRGSVRLEAVVP